MKLDRVRQWWTNKLGYSIYYPNYNGDNLKLFESHMKDQLVDYNNVALLPYMYGKLFYNSYF